MLAADTNVIVRILVSDDLAQQQAAHARLKAAETAGQGVYVGDIVLAEISWVLESVYGYEREAIGEAIEAVITTRPLQVASRDAVLQALEWYREGRADLTDYLILAAGRERGAARLLTFEERLGAHPLCERP